MRHQTRLACLSILVLCAATACSSNLQPPSSGTGGTPATGGTPGTGGLPGTGGVPGTGGASTGGQGGAVTCGPTTCNPGEYCCNALCGICAPPGSACVQGCAVGGNGGSGSGGGGGSDGATCAALSAAYQVAMTAARICNDGVSGQCAQVAIVGLPVSGCPNGCGTVWVNDLTPLNTIRGEWEKAGCQGPGACPLVECNPLYPAGQCVASDGGQALCETFAAD